MTWSETGLSLDIDELRRTDFGTELITRRIPYELRGSGTLEFLPAGVRATIMFPIVDGQSILQSGPKPVLEDTEP